MRDEGVLEMWTVYNRPLDYPEAFVARLHVVSKGSSRPTDQVVISGSLGHIRNTMRRRGLVRIERDPRDDPKIVEVWL